MLVTMILLAAGTMVLLGLLFGLVLGWSNVKFAVDQDPKVDEVLAVLPAANCGGCGLPGCAEFAKGVVQGQCKADGCTAGGQKVARMVAAILGVDLEERCPYRPVVHCAADLSKRKGLADYRGEQTCFGANVIGGVQGCTYGCLGLSDCVTACKFDAISIVNGLAVVDYDKCTGCGACEKACPRHIISMEPFKAERMLVIACSNHDSGRLVRQVCDVGCIGCKLCQKMLDVFEVQDNLSRINYEKYQPTTDFSAVLEKCPMEGMIYVGKPSQKDLDAVADKVLPARVTDQFETTADQTQWRG